MTIFYEEDLKNYESYTNEQLLFLWQSERDERARIVLSKRNQHNMTGDVFIYKGNIYNLERYKALNAESTVTNIVDAEAEFIEKWKAKELEQQQAQEV